MPLDARQCKPVPGNPAKLLSLLGTLAASQAEGRGFESRFPLQRDSSLTRDLTSLRRFAFVRALRLITLMTG